MPDGQDENGVVAEQLVVDDVRKAAELSTTGLSVHGRCDLGVPLDLRNARFKALNESGPEPRVLRLVSVSSSANVIPRSAPERSASAHSSDQSCLRTSSQGIKSSG